MFMWQVFYILSLLPSFGFEVLTNLPFQSSNAGTEDTSYNGHKICFKTFYLLLVFHAVHLDPIHFPVHSHLPSALATSSQNKIEFKREKKGK